MRNAFLTPSTMTAPAGNRRLSLLLMSLGMHVTLGGFSLISVHAEEDSAGPIAIAEVEREEPVDFAKEIYPLLKKNCIACHNSSSPKAKLNLENPASILAGGNDGPAIVPGKPEESFLLQVASHQEDPIMPPEGNKANAVPFTPEELGLLSLWIAEGAKGEALVATPTPTEWMLAEGNAYPVYHLALGHEDRYVAASRGQRVFLYDIRQGTSLGELVDPALKEEPGFGERPPAHRDFVQSVAFSPEGWIATGGFRNAKLWRPVTEEVEVVQTLEAEVTSLESSPAGGAVAAADARGHLYVGRGAEALRDLGPKHAGAVTGLAFSSDGTWLASAGADGSLQLLEVDSGKTVRQWGRSDEGSPTGWQTLAVLSSPDRLLAGAADGALILWDLAAILSAEGEIPGAIPVGQQESGVSAATGSPTNPQVFFVGCEDGTVTEWRAGEAASTRRYDHGEPVIDLVVSGDGHHLLTISEGKARVWKTADGAAAGEVTLDPGAVRLAAVEQRELSVAQALVETRRQRSSEREKAWTDEMEKAKQAAGERLKALAAFDAADRTAHTARLEAGQAQSVHREALADVEKLKAEVEAQQARSGALAERLTAAREAQGPQFAALDAKVSEGKTQREQLASTVASGQERLQRQTRARDRAQQALTALREVDSQWGQDSTAAEAVLQTENLLADVQQAVSLQEGQLWEQQQSLKALDEQIAGWEAERKEAETALHHLEAETVEAQKSLETLQATLAAAESAVGPVAEKEKTLVEAAGKAEEARAEAQRALDQAAENEELAIRLSQRAAEARMRAITALTKAESQAEEIKTRIEGGGEAPAEGQEEAAKAEEVKVRLTDAAFSLETGTFVIARTGAGLLHVSPDGQEAWTLPSMQEGMGSVLVTYDPGRKKWLAAGPDKVLRSLRGQAGWEWAQTLGTIEDPKQLIDRVTAVAFNPAGTLVATGSGVPSRSGQLKIWRVADGSEVMEIEDAHSDTVVGLEFSPDGRYLATASTDRFAKVFSVSDGQRVTALEGHTGHVLDVAWRPDGLVLATAGADNVVKLWDFEEQRQLKTVDGYNQEITSVAFLDTAEKLLTTSGDRSVRMGGDRLDGKEFVYDGAMTRDGERLVAASQDSVVRVWTTQDKKLVKEFPAP